MRLSERGRVLMLIPIFWLLVALFWSGCVQAAGTCTTWHRMDYDGSYADDIDVGPASGFCAGIGAFHSGGSTIVGCSAISVTEYHASYSVIQTGGQWYYIAERNGCTPDPPTPTNEDEVQAQLTIFASLLGMLALVWGVKQVYRTLSNSRSES